ncbi:alpha/beta hydrolase [Enteractinococcus coprophilus]|uniref:Phospholipase/carboxylesterase n=1 Tax=Enteractinococcus coprophilus TaxID=1027633 RepID=A0A543AFA0_9MICC|nr:phospholipase [Enteractinococcus coprophilus]TQL71206.1 phospholipase/carboxylesterase [Enteractinococcus coprophilus]
MHVRWSHEEPRPETDLVVFLHGFGADENDLFPLSNYFDDRFTIASVQAPKQLPPHFGGYCWFPISAALEANVDDIRTALVQLDDWVHSVADNYRSVSLLGFSQGMAMATSLMRMRPGAYPAVVGLSGFVIESPELDDLFQDEEFAASDQPLFWGYDPADPVVATDRIEQTGAWLRPCVQLVEKTYRGIGHGIHPEEMGHVLEFLNDHV